MMRSISDTECATGPNIQFDKIHSKSQVFIMQSLLFSYLSGSG